MSLFLAPDDIRDLTDRKTRPAQAARLRAMKIPFLWDAEDGRIKVLRAVVEKRAGGQPSAANEAPEPDFSWMKKPA